MYFRIKKLAEERGKTIADVSRESGVSESAFSMMKRRAGNPNGGRCSVDNAAKIAKVLDVPIEALLEESAAS